MAWHDDGEPGEWQEHHQAKSTEHCRSGAGGRRLVSRGVGDNVVPPEDSGFEQEPEPHEGSQAGAHEGSEGRVGLWECPEPDTQPRGESQDLFGLTTFQDVVIMEGRQIQHAYHHRVIPTGLRAAATARVIREE